MTSNDKSQSDEQYLHGLVKAMILADGAELGLHIPQCAEHYTRTLPSLTSDHLNPKSCELKANFSSLVASLAAPMDDPVYVKLHDKYVGQILYDFETRASVKLFRVTSIQFIRSYTSTRYSCWEATCEPVARDAKTGHFRVPAEMQVPDSKVTVTHALQGYCLAEYANGSDAEPTFYPWVEQYIAHFREVLVTLTLTLTLTLILTLTLTITCFRKVIQPQHASIMLPNDDATLSKTDLPSSQVCCNPNPYPYRNRNPNPNPNITEDGLAIQSTDLPSAPQQTPCLVE